MGVLNANPFLLGLVNLLVVLIRDGAALVLDGMADISLVANHCADSCIVPQLVLVMWVSFAKVLVVIFSRRYVPVLVEDLSNLTESVAFAA